MKPSVEAIGDQPHFNWKISEYVCNVPNENFTCAWHYHVEYELVLYRDPGESFEGNFFAGDHIGKVDHNTLLLFGPGLPHMLSGRSFPHASQPHKTFILWFTQSWIDNLIQAAPELAHIKAMLNLSYKGIEFSKELGEKLYLKLKDHDVLPAHKKLLYIMEVLTLLVEDKVAVSLSSSNYGIEQATQPDKSFSRVETARNFIETHYQEPIKICDFCKALHMSESSAYRLFEKHFKESFSEHLKKFRIGKACELLVNSNIPVSLVAERSGFNNLSNFNRQFKERKQMTPSDFRGQFIRK